MFVDERGAGYFAVGYSLASKKPAVLVCTSGTALANYFPAVLEAYYSHVPLIIFSADRPPELRETGANQTIDQVKIFSKFVHGFIDLPPPSPDMSSSFLLSSLAHLLSIAVSRKGPVHLNFMFREPFLAGTGRQPLLEKKKNLLPERWLKDRKPYTRHNVTFNTAPVSLTGEVFQCISSAKNGLVVIGRLPLQYGKNTYSQLQSFLTNLAWPVHSDALSGRLRGENVLSFGSGFLKELASSFDTILILGERIISKEIQEMISCSQTASIIQVTEYEMKSDPDHRMNIKLVSDTDYFFRKMNSLMRGSGYSPKRTPLRKEIAQREKYIKKILREFDRQRVWSSLSVVRTLEKRLNRDIAVFAGNSMSIRLINDHTCLNQQGILIAANRGVSGIDGSLASALGFSEAVGKPVCLLVGDLAFLHDMNSLHLLRRSSHGMIILLLNDNGGGIFSLLGLSRLKSYRDMFKEVFVTPQNTDYMFSAKQFGLSYLRVESLSQLEEGYTQAVKALQEKKSTLLEAILEQEMNNKILKDLQKRIQEF